ncbi:JmjC domain-containing protein [Actinophytocola sediminis]
MTMETACRPGEALATIFESVDPDRFAREHWPDRHVVEHGDVDQLRAQPAFRRVGTLDDVVARYDGPVMVYGEVIIAETEGVSDRMLVDADKCLEWYEKGAALEFDMLDEFVPELGRLAERLRGELGLPKTTSKKAIAYAATRGGGLRPHFDAYCNFVFQLVGDKAWLLQPNANAAEPLQHYELADAPYLPDELAAYWQGEPPADGLPDAERVLLRPGSRMFLPRGYWHATESSWETLAINITFGQPTWLDYVLAELRTRLAGDRRWRRLATAGDLLTAEGRSELEHLLGELPAAVGEVTVADMLASQNRNPDVYHETQRLIRQLLRFG